MHDEKVLEHLNEAMKVLLTEPIGSRQTRLTDLTPRDGQQCKLATRVTTEDLLPLCEALDRCGFYAVEVWGGATFDVCLRYLNEDPWERAVKELGPLAKSDEDILLGVLFPMQARSF
jgi:2-oxoglutarate carboxylase large subunit